MKIHFRISYHTKWGEQLLVTGNTSQLGNGVLSKAYALTYTNNDTWEGEIELSETDGNFGYNYVLFNENNGSYMPEWGSMRKINFQPGNAGILFCVDLWNSPAEIENNFLTSPFKDVLLKNDHVPVVLAENENYTHIFRVKAPVLKTNECVCISGDCLQLGNWSTLKPELLSYQEDGWWVYKTSFKNVRTNVVSYKYGIYDSDNKVFRNFENGNDRITFVLNNNKVKILQTDGFVRTPNQEWRGAGVGLPVFSLRTKESCGVGDFADLLKFVDWAKKAGLKLIQVLPLNDTIGTHTDADVLPYAAISAFALNPLYLNLNALGKLPETNTIQKEFKKNRDLLNNQKLVPFLDVVNFKMKYAREIYFNEKEKILKDKKFTTFIEENKYWLISYAGYCVLRDKYGTPDYREWKEFSKYNEKNIEVLSLPESEYFDEIYLNYFVQYHLHIQLKKASEYAHKNGIILKGDIPIGVNRNSVDTWANPQLFNMHRHAGAPPDMFAVKGQNWELPTYNWEIIKQTNFDWWKKRLSKMSEYFDTFRIDHILGFFRIWEIPLDQVEGIMGHLQPSVPVHINEFAEKGIWFDYNRFCKPYISDAILWDFFGEESLWVKANCLHIEDGWILRLKPPYLSQVYVEKLFTDGKISERVKFGLFDLISNVLFFEVEGSNQTLFYPRFGMENLRTFRELDEGTKVKLREIYVDYFYRRQDDFWYHSGMEKLPVLKRSTNMLICGEDLGMMTHCVTTVMNELGILSLEVQRAPKTNKAEFAHPANAPYLSVVTPSTHDMSTIRGWWEEDRNITQRFYNSQLGHYGEAPYFCEPWICRDIILQHLYSPAMWAIFQMQDLLSISDKIRRENPHDERINVPSDSKSSWRYRLHLNLEDLMKNTAFNDELKNYIVQSGR